MATRVISTKLSVEGEAEFKKQMGDVNSHLKTLKSEMSVVTAEFKGQANSLEALTAKDKILREQLEQQVEKMRALEEAVKEAAEAYGEQDKRTDGYKQSLNAAKIALSSLNESVLENDKYLKEAKSSTDGHAYSIDGYGQVVNRAAECAKFFQQALAAYGEDANRAKTSVATLQSEINLLNSEWRGQANTLPALLEKHQLLNRQFAEQQSVVQKLEDAYQEHAKAFGDSSFEAMKYEQELNAAKITLNNMSDALQENDKYLKEAKSSTDGHAYSIDGYGQVVNRAAECAKFFQQALAAYGEDANRAKTSVATLQSEINLLNSEWRGQANTLPALLEKHQLLNRQFAEQQSVVQKLEDAYQEYAKAFGDSSFEAMKYEQELNAAKITLNNMSDALQENNKYLSEAQKSSDGCAASIDEFGNQVKEAKDDTSSFGDVLRANLTSEAIIFGVKALASAVGSIASSAKESILAASELGDTIDKASQRVGLSAEEYQKWVYAAGLSGIDESKVEDLAKKQQTFFSQAKQGASGAADAYAALGVNISEIEDSGEAFNQVIAALADMEDVTQRNALASQIFGENYVSLAPMLNGSSAAIQAAKQEIEDLGGVMSNQAVAASAAFQDSLTRLQASFDGLKNNLAGEFLPSITEIMDGMTLVMQGNVEEGMAAIEQGLQNFQIQLEALGPLAEEALQLLVSVIVEHLPEIIDMGAVLLESLIDGIAAQMPELVPVVVDLILTIVDALLSNLDVLVEAAMQLTIGLATGLVKAAPQLAAKVPQLISAIAAALRRGLTQMASIGQELVRGLWNGISNMGAWIGQKIKGFGQNVVNKLKDFFGIKSPSTLMRDEIGKHLATGTVDGFEDEMAHLQGKMAKAIPSNFEVMASLNTSLKTPRTGITAAELSSSLQTAAAMAGGQEGDIVINLNTTLDGEVVSRSTTRIQRRKAKTYGNKLVTA